MIITLLITYNEYQEIQTQKRAVFSLELSIIKKRIEMRLDQYQSSMLLVKGFFIHAESLSGNVFFQFVSESLLVKNHPGIISLGFLKINDWKTLKARIEFLEPYDRRNQLVAGHELIPGPILSAAMINGLKTNLPVLSKKLFIENEPGFIFLVPVFKKDKSLSGFIFTVIIARDLFTNILKDFKSNIDIEIYDGPIPNIKSYVFDLDLTPHFLKENFNSFQHSLLPIELGGQKFFLYSSALPGFQDEGKNSYLWFLAVGLVFSLLLASIMLANRKHEKEINARVEELQVTQKKLLHTQNSLKAAIKSRDEFLSIASHELKNPMTAIRLKIQMLQRQLKRVRDVNEFKDKIDLGLMGVNGQISTLNRLVEDMLDISRLRTGKLKIITAPFDLAELIEETVANVTEQMLSEGYPPPILEMSGNLIGTWDKTRLGQVLNNLLTNAIRYGKQKQITITAQEGAEKTVIVSVKDEGIGISPEDQQRIFEKFERATSSSEGRGLGLGLFISFSIIRAHKGRIGVQSAPDQGSTFTFEIPKSPNGAITPMVSQTQINS